MTIDEVIGAIPDVPEGAYAVGVSGGADSVALLHLLRHYRRQVAIHVVHLDHESRGADSTADASFVRELAGRWELAYTIARRSEVEGRMGELPQNKSARFRAVRYQLFREVVEAHGLRGVLLAHHADDQAETVLQRLLRGTHAPYLAGMAKEARVKGVLVVRPLLDVTREALRAYLRAVEQKWREDTSNESDEYFRNRLRCVLTGHSSLSDALRAAGDAIGELRRWARATAPRLEARFDARALHGFPSILAAEGARRWLKERGVAADEISPAAVSRLVEMATDAASPPRQNFASDVTVRRRGGAIFVEGTDA